MDLSEGSDEETDIVYQQDINEDDLLGGSDEDEGGAHLATSNTRRFSTPYSQCEGPDSIGEDEYVLDLELGEDVDELELVPESVGRARVAPVKVRAVVLKTETADSTNVGVDAEQVNEVGSQSQSQNDSSTITRTSESDTADEETEKVQRTRFTTERQGLVGGSEPRKNNNVMGNPIQTLGQRKAWNFPNPSGPRFRNNQMRQMRPRHFNQNPNPYNQQRQFFPPNRNVQSVGLLGRSPQDQRQFREFRPRAGIISLGNPAPAEVPIFQFPEQIFTDFNKPMAPRPPLPIRLPLQNPQMPQNTRPNPFLQLPAPLPGGENPQPQNGLLQTPNFIQNQNKSPTNINQNLNGPVVDGQIKGSLPKIPGTSINSNQPRKSNESHPIVIVSSGSFPGSSQQQRPRFNDKRQFKPQQKMNNSFPPNNLEVRVSQPGGQPEQNQSMGMGVQISRTNMNPTVQQPENRVHHMRQFNNQPRTPMQMQMQFQGPRPELENIPQFPSMFVPGLENNQTQFWAPPQHQEQPMFMQQQNQNPNFIFNGQQGPSNFGYRSPMQQNWNMVPPTPGLMGNIAPNHGPPFQPTYPDYNHIYQQQYQQQHQLQMLQERNMFVPGRVFENVPQESMYQNQNTPVVPNQFNFGMSSSNSHHQEVRGEIKLEPEFRRDGNWIREQERQRERERERDYRERYDDVDQKSATKRSFTTEEFIRVGQPEKKLKGRLGPPVGKSAKEKEDQIVKIMLETQGTGMGLEEDEIYMQKVEQQRLQREEIQRVKEERRKLALKPGEPLPKDAEVKEEPKVEPKPEATLRYFAELQPGPFSKQAPQSIHINPLTFKGDLRLLNNNLKKINMNVTSGSSTSVPSSSRSIETPSFHSQSRGSVASDELKRQVTVTPSDSSQRERKILRIVKNKRGEIISKSKVIVVRKQNPNQD